jgi:hypothetical protein
MPPGLVGGIGPVSEDLLSVHGFSPAQQNFQQAFDHLDRFLCHHKPLWTESAFSRNELSWITKYPNLYGDLLALSEAEVLALEQETKLGQFMTSYLMGPQTLPEGPLLTYPRVRWRAPEALVLGVPERKRAQAEGFVSALMGSEIGLSSSASGKRLLVDWCSGRGLLARQMHGASGALVVCLERDARLCQTGHLANLRLDPQMAEKVVFVVHDVMEAVPPPYLESSSLHTALHACGDLHVSMLQQASRAGVQALACSPCCYHFTSQKVYQGLSQRGLKSALKPTRDELRLATAEISTANRLERTLRHRELLWRVAFDLRVRQLRGVNSYCPTPSVRKSLLKTDFSTFAESLCQSLEARGRRDFDFPRLSEQAEAKLLQQAQSKLSKIMRLEKAQLAFRRALELWLLLDRALFLQEKGYSVEIQEFCAKPHSGRNSVLLAWRSY